MVNWDKKFEKSPYDTAGMPLAATTVDMDAKEDVAKLTVHDKYEAPVGLNDLEFDSSVTEADWQKRTRYNPVLNNTAIQTPGHAIYKKHEEDLGQGIGGLSDPPEKLDLDNPENHEKLAEEDPKQTNTSKLKSDKVDHDDDKEDKTITTAEGVKHEEDVNTLDRHNNPADEDFMELLKDADNDGK